MYGNQVSIILNIGVLETDKPEDTFAPILTDNTSGLQTYEYVSSGNPTISANF